MNKKAKKAQVNFRNGGSYLTEIDDVHKPSTLATRMCGGGYLICRENRWGKRRTLIINLIDVSSIVIEEEDEFLGHPDESGAG